MGAAYRSNTKKADTRQPNLGASGMPTTIKFAVDVDGEWIGDLDVPQNAKLSDKGNVTYMGGIQGWVLEGDFDRTLRSIAISADGVRLETSTAGVHQSGNGNPQVFKTGAVSLRVAGADEVRRYQAKVHVTYSAKKGTYAILAKVFPLPQTSGPREPKITGTLTGSFVIARPEKVAA